MILVSKRDPRTCKFVTTETKYKKTEHECGICLNTKKYCKKYVVVCNNHSFHEICLKKWCRHRSRLGQIPSCPLCRTDISYYYDEEKENILKGKNLTQYKMIPTRFNSNKEIVSILLNVNGLLLSSVGHELKDDLNLVLIAVRNNGLALDFCTPLMKNRIDVVKTALKSTHVSLKFAGLQILKDKTFLLSYAINHFYSSSFNVKYFHESLREDADFMMEVVRKNSYTFPFLPHRFRADQAFILRILPTNPFFIVQHMARNLRRDEEIVKLLLSINGIFFSFVYQYFGENRKFILQAVKNNGLALEYMNETFRGDREVIMHAIGNQPTAIRFANIKFRQEKAIMLQTITAEFTTFRFASNYLKNNYEFLAEALRVNINCFKYFSSQTRSNIEIVSKLIEDEVITPINYELVVSYFGTNILSDSEFMLSLLKKNSGIFQYCTYAQRNTMTFADIALSQNLTNIVYCGYDILSQIRSIQL